MRSKPAATALTASAANAAAPATARAGSDGAKHLKLQVRRARERDKAVLGPALAAALDLDGVTQDVLAIACGVSRQLVSDWHMPHEDAVPNALHARLAHAAGLVQWARAVGVQHLPAPVADEPESVRTARLVKELLDVPTIATANLAGDGVRDGYERGLERRELLEARAVIDARLALLDHEDAQARMDGGR